MSSYVKAKPKISLSPSFTCQHRSHERFNDRCRLAAKPKKNASTAARVGHLSFCRPAAADPLVNASVSVPVQSYRSEGSQALCLVNPWERPHSVLLSENQNTDSIGENTRAGNGGGGGRKRRGKKGRNEHETSHIRKIHIRKYSEEEEEEEGGSLESKRRRIKCRDK